METTELGLTDLARAIADRQVDAVTAVTAALDRMDAAQPGLNAFRLIRRERALVEAAEADRRIAAGERLPLLGVPVAIKDDTDIAGEPTAFGCGGDFPPAAADAEAVRRLRAAGAILVGKTNTCELGQYPFTSGDAFGHTRNPWSAEHTPGGSSGGSAAAVAAGLVPAALGSDGAGSIRIPSAWTHLVGIKPQRGRVSTWPEPEAFHGLTVNGPLARTVADAALLLDVCAGNHPGELHSPPAIRAVDAVRRDPGRLRVAVASRAPFTGIPTRLDPQVHAGVQRIAAQLRALGHSVAEVELPYNALFTASFLPRSVAGVAAWYDRMPGSVRVDKRTMTNVRTGRALSGLPLAAARRLEPLLHKRIGAMYRDFDLVLAPTTATPPPPVHAPDNLGSFATDRFIASCCPYAWTWNVLGWPSVNVPAGFTDSGLPVGAQLLGTADSEPLLISTAAQLESELRWDLLRPDPWWLRDCP
ncbi:amidase [Nocardia sp. NPDC050793]|uniref:amidase n=1 Tax=Nocardia sp. NPDC050793 TaxID=3155159 RepID=UPI0033C27C29